MANPRIPYQLSTSRPPLPRLKGKSILVHLVVNVEHWPFDRAMPRTILTPPHGHGMLPDVPNFSWADYGMRAGLPRILHLFKSRGVPASTSFNAGVIEAYPEAAEAILKAGWEFIGHGLHQKAIQNMDGDAEAEMIAAALDKIERFTGTRPRGWLSPGLRESERTPDLLKANGVDYVCDWVVDDVPCWMTTANGPLVAMPYNLEVNDSVIYAVERHATGEMGKRVGYTLSLFEEESETAPRVFAIGLHPHLIGVPHRFHELEHIVDRLAANENVLFTTGSALCDWFMAAMPAEAPAKA